MNKEIYGVKSKHHPGIIKKLETFKKDLFDIASSLNNRVLPKTIERRCFQYKLVP